MKFYRSLAVPALIWYVLFILGPLILILVTSFLQRGPYGGILWNFQFDNYLKLFKFENLMIIGRSLQLALTTSLVATFLGLICAWGIVCSSGAWRSMFLGLITLPFLTNSIIRIYSIKLFVGTSGPVPIILNYLNLNYDPTDWSTSSALVMYGMISSYLPFAVLPIYGAFEKIDLSLIEAAQDLGAKSWNILWKVIFPVLKPACAGAFLLVFIPTLGEYLIPDLLGGAQTTLIGNFLTEQFLKSRNWPMGSAVAIGLMVSLFGCYFIYKKARFKKAVL